MTELTKRSTMLKGCDSYYFQAVIYGLVTSVKIEQNTSKKLSKSEPRFLFVFGE